MSYVLSRFILFPLAKSFAFSAEVFLWSLFFFFAENGDKGLFDRFI